jgi:hypothetical protein
MAQESVGPATQQPTQQQVVQVVAQVVAVHQQLQQMAAEAVLEFQAVVVVKPTH